MQPLNSQTKENNEAKVKRSFRLRLVDTTGKLSKKYGYIQSRSIQVISWIQFLLGFALVSSQIFVIASSGQHVLQTVSFGSFGALQTGLGFLIMFASIMTLMTTVDSVYFWLHMSMSLNIIVACGSYAVAMYTIYNPLQELEKMYNNLGPNFDESNESRGHTVTELSIVLKGLIKYCYLSIILCALDIPIAMVLGVCGGLPVCRGQKHVLPAGKRKPSDLSPSPRSPVDLRSF